MLAGVQREWPVRPDGKAQVDVEVATFIVAASGRDEELGDVGLVVSAPRQAVKLPGRLLRPAVHGVDDLVRRQEELLVHDQVAGVNVQAVVALDLVAGEDLAVLQQADLLDLRGLHIRQRLMQQEAVHVIAVAVKDVQMDVVKALAKGDHRPVDDVADVRGRRDEAAVHRISQIFVVLVPDVLRDGLHVNVVELPEETVRVQDGDFPIAGVAGVVILNVDDLPAGVGEDFRAVRRAAVNAVMKVRAAAVVLVGRDNVADGFQGAVVPGVLREAVHLLRLGVGQLQVVRPVVPLGVVVDRLAVVGGGEPVGWLAGGLAAGGDGGDGQDEAGHYQEGDDGRPEVRASRRGLGPFFHEIAPLMLSCCDFPFPGKWSLSIFPETSSLFSRKLHLLVSGKMVVPSFRENGRS